ncbi:EamA family transporter, partial [Acinetobacter baumannii]
LLLFLAFWLQIEGLARTSSNRNAFVTGLNVLVVPLIAMLALGRRYGWQLWAACAMAFAGMALMFHENEPWNLGDTLTLASTVFYALYILAL